MSLADQLEAARAEVARLERLARTASCAELGHDLALVGGRNCGCFDGSYCSVPVHECRRCGGCDYGESDEATAAIENCKHRLAYIEEQAAAAAEQE